MKTRTDTQITEEQPLTPRGLWPGSEGFSLMEVNLAILLVSVGLLVLFALFPLGLRESEMAIVDTHEAMFADHVLCTIEGSAQSITNWTTWSDMAAFGTEVAFDLPGITLNYDGTKLIAEATGTMNIEFPPNSERYVQYRLEIFEDSNGRRKTVRLKAKSGQYGSFEENYQVYFADLMYLGM